MFNNFFTRSDNNQVETTEDANKRVASISYGIDNTGELHIDVEVDSFSDDTIDKLSKILVTLSMDSCYLETIQMIQTSLQQHGQEDALMRIYAEIAANPNDKALRIHKEKTKDKPCIRPSDML